MTADDAGVAVVVLAGEDDEAVGGVDPAGKLGGLGTCLLAGCGHATLYRHFPLVTRLSPNCSSGRCASTVPLPDEPGRRPIPPPRFATSSALLRHPKLKPSVGRPAARTPVRAACRHHRADRGRRSARCDLQLSDVALLMVANAGLIHRTADDAPGPADPSSPFGSTAQSRQSDPGAPPAPYQDAMTRALKHPSGCDIWDQKSLK